MLDKAMHVTKNDEYVNLLDFWDLVVLKCKSGQ